MANDSTTSARPTAAFVGASWAALVLGVGCFVVGLWNATMTRSEKGFYGLAFAMTLFAGVAVQKNVRDTLQYRPASHAAPKSGQGPSYTG